MKKIIAFILAVLMTAGCFAETEVTATETPELGEGEMRMHGYLSPYGNYYIGVPADWVIIGAGSTDDNMTEAEEMLGEMDIYGLKAQMGAENDVLYCVSKDGAGLILTYGASTGVSDDALVQKLDEFKASIKEKCHNVVFSEDSGAYTYKSVLNILHIGMTYSDRKIDQYYLVAGLKIFMFTFFNAKSEEVDAVLSCFDAK